MNKLNISTIQLSVVICLISVVGCKKDPEPYMSSTNSGWVYQGGEATINSMNQIEVDFDISGNLNVNGSAIITADSKIEGDLNLNNGGTAEIDIPWDRDTVYVLGNVNVNDSMVIQDGVLHIHGNLNLNSSGVINIFDAATLLVDGDINNSGEFYGMRNTTVIGTVHQNSGGVSQEEPLN